MFRYLLYFVVSCFLLNSPSFVHATSAPSNPIEKLLKNDRKKKKKSKKNQPAPAPAPYHCKSSALANQLLTGLRGIEIGGSAHNCFNLNTLNIDYTDDYNTAFKQHEIKVTGGYLKVDIVSPGDDLPFKDNVWDFVINSHAVEHFYDPIKAIKEWLRVTKPGGYVFIIAPHKERTFDRDRPRSTLAEIIDRHEHPNPPVPMNYDHHSVWITEDFIEICNYYGWPICAVQDVDDKVGNGFTVVIQKPL